MQRSPAGARWAVKATHPDRKNPSRWMLHSRVRGNWGQVEGKAGARHATENTRKRACETSAVKNPGL